MNVHFEDLKIGDFFKADERSAITYQVQEHEGILGKVRKGYNTRTGELEFVFGLVARASSMSAGEITAEQENHQMWGRMWAGHDQKLKNGL